MRVVLLQHRRGQQPDRVVLHRRDGRRRAAVVPRRSATAGWRSSRRTIPARWCSTPRSAGRSASRSSSIRASSARACRATSCATASPARAIVIVQRLRARAAAAEDRARRGRRSSAGAEALIVTRGEHGSSVMTATRHGSTCAAVTPRAHRRSDRRRRRLPRRADEGARARPAMRRPARGWAASPRPTRSSTSAARATRTPGRSSGSGTRRTSARSRFPHDRQFLTAPSCLSSQSSDSRIRSGRGMLWPVS